MGMRLGVRHWVVRYKGWKEAEQTNQLRRAKLSGVEYAKHRRRVGAINFLTPLNALRRRKRDAESASPAS